MRKGYIMQYVIVFFCLAAFYVVGLASLLLHLIREYRQYKTKRQDTSPAVGWQTSTLPGPRPPIVPVERVPTRPVEVPPQEEDMTKPLYEREFDEIMTRGLQKWKEEEKGA